MLQKVKNLLENNLIYNLILMFGFILNITFGNPVSLFISFLFGSLIAYKLIILEEKSFEERKEAINKDFENLNNSTSSTKESDTKNNSLFDDFTDKSTFEDFFKKALNLPPDAKVHIIDDINLMGGGSNIQNNPFANKKGVKPKEEDLTDRVIYLDNKLAILTGKISEHEIKDIRKKYEMLSETGQNEFLVEKIYNEFFNTDFEPTFEEKLNFFKNKLTDVTLHKNKMENDKLTLLFLVDIEKNGESKFMEDLRAEAIKKEMYEFLIELTEYEEKQRNKSL
jgi:hypothetical protein